MYIYIYTYIQVDLDWMTWISRSTGAAPLLIELFLIMAVKGDIPL